MKMEYFNKFNLNLFALYLYSSVLIITCEQNFRKFTVQQNRLHFDITYAQESIFKQRNKSSLPTLNLYHLSNLSYFSIDRNVEIKDSDNNNALYIRDYGAIGEDQKILGVAFLLDLADITQQQIYRNTVTVGKNLVQRFLRNKQKEQQTLIFKVNPFYTNGKMCDCREFNTKLQIFLVKMSSQVNISSTVNRNFGLEYDEQLIACCNITTFSALEKVNTAVFVLKINPINTFLSADIFTESIKITIDANRKFVRTASSNVKIFIRIKLLRIEGLNDLDITHFKYLAHIKGYMELWLKMESLDEVVVLETFPKSVKANEYTVQNILPILFESHPRHHWESFKSPCQIQSLVKLISKSFGDFIFQVISAQSMKRLQTECLKYSNLTQLTSLQASNISVTIPSAFANERKNLEEFFNWTTSSTGLHFNTVYFEVSQTQSYGKWVSQIGSSSFTENLNSVGTQVVCYVIHAKVQKAVSMCNRLFTNSSKLYIDWVLGEEQIQERLPKVLADIQEQRNLFAEMYPEKELIIGFIISNDNSNPYFPASAVRYSARQTIYCESSIQKLYETYDGILTFAEIHQFGKVVINSAMHRGHIGGWWVSIETLKSVSRSVTDFPLLVQRNVPLNIAKRLELSNQFDCIQWSEDVDENLNNFKDTTVFGASIDIFTQTNVSISVNDLQTLLLFSLSKFSFVEIILEDEIQLNTMSAAITHELNEIAMASGTDSRYAYMVEVPYSFLLHDVTVNLIWDENVIQSVGIHFSILDIFYDDYREYRETKIQTYYNKKAATNSTKPELGITINNCQDEMNTQFRRIRSLVMLDFISYAVCEFSPIKAENHNQAKMQRFLDTVFYTEQYFRQFGEFKNIRIYFRLNFLNDNCEGRTTDTASYLRFINDMYEHSKVYGIRYLVKAFEQTNETDCPRAWWNVDDTHDLSNLSVYTERHSEYFGRGTELILKLNTTKSMKNESALNSTQSVITIIVSAVLLLIAFSFVLGLWYRLKTIRKRYLTDKEIDMFRNGSKLELDQDSVDLWDRLKFDSRYEVNKEDIQLYNRIGKGRFGQVFKALLKDETYVAVKMPQNDCLKESFISMLAEVKILCYIGTHPFVVEFVGAHTHEIGRGKLYIITEYCENGCLHGYLQDKKITTNRNEEIELKEQVNVYQLCLFSLQIAKGMEYIADKNVIHGDLSTRNVLLNGDMVCKIGDFGLSRRLYENTEYVKKTKEPLPWRWLAIECLTNRTFTSKSDVWSFGVTIWEIFSFGNLPYPSKEFTEVFIAELENGMRLSKALYSTDVIHAKLLDCWEKDPHERPEFGQLVEFFADLQSAEYETL